MSSLFYINDPIPFVMIGGKSGSGKTSLIDILLSDFPNHFEQPKSYTSRPKRNENDRYTFVSKEEMINMYDNGDLMNLDHVHGHYYGISSNSISDIIQNGRIPIKEIHPKNFHKFRDREFQTICIYVANKHLSMVSVPFDERNLRADDNFEYDGFPDYDIELNISNLSKRDAADYLIKRLCAYKIHTHNLPDPKLIETENSVGYSAIAAEFTDNLRVTTKNFHDASLNFWHDHLYRYTNTDDQCRILEIGSGNGWLFNNINGIKASIYGIDIAKGMYAQYCAHTFNCSVRSIPVAAHYFDLVVGSLIDPMVTPELFIEIERLLKPEGEFIFTVPTRQWSDNLAQRVDKDKTVFQTAQGKQVHVFSFCNALQAHSMISSFCNLPIVDSKLMCLGSDYSGKISPAIISSATSVRMDERKLPIVLGVKCKRNGDI